MGKLAERLKQSLDEIGISKAELARRANITRQSLNSYLVERTRPSQETITSLANALGVNPAWLDGYDVPKRTSNSNKELTLEEALTSVMSYDGKPMTDNDKEIIEGIIKGYMENKKE